MWQDASWIGRFEAVSPTCAGSSTPVVARREAWRLILGAALGGRGETREARADRGRPRRGRLPREESVDDMGPPHAMSGLIWCERSDDAVRLGADMLAEGRRRGSVFGAMAEGTQQGLALLDVSASLPRQRPSWRTPPHSPHEHGATVPRALSLSYLTQVRLARGHADQHGDELDALPDGLITSARLTIQQTRGLVRLARGERHAGVEDLRAAELTCRAAPTPPEPGRGRGRRPARCAWTRAPRRRVRSPRRICAALAPRNLARRRGSLYGCWR